MSLHRFGSKLIALIAASATVAVLSGCSSQGASPTSSAVSLRLGYLPRITHASALVALHDGFFAKQLGPQVNFTAKPFSRGTEEVTALLSGQLDAAYVGPNPAFNAWQKSGGKAIKIISGAASGGTSMVVKPDIKTAADLKGKTVADPALGGTQDVSLRDWLARNGLKTNIQGGGDVSVKPTNPESAIVQQFLTDQIAGAIDSAPFDVQMIKAGGCDCGRTPTPSPSWSSAKNSLRPILTRSPDCCAPRPRRPNVSPRTALARPNLPMPRWRKILARGLNRMYSRPPSRKPPTPTIPEWPHCATRSPRRWP